MYLELAFVLSVVFGMIVILTALYGRSLYRPALICMCIGYLAGLIYYTFLWGNRAGISSFDYSVNHVLIDSIIGLNYTAATHTAFMNLCLFVPFGYLLPQISGTPERMISPDSTINGKSDGISSRAVYSSPLRTPSAAASEQTSTSTAADRNAAVNRIPFTMRRLMFPTISPPTGYAPG